MMFSRWGSSIQVLFLIAPLPKVMVEANPVGQIATSMGASGITGIKREAPRVHIVRKNPYLLLKNGQRLERGHFNVEVFSGAW